jgi:hypothetical protein
MNGRQDVVECTFVKSDVTDAPYFSTPCRLGKNGVEESLGMGQLSDYEKAKLEEVSYFITRACTHPIVCHPNTMPLFVSHTEQCICLYLFTHLAIIIL